MFKSYSERHLHFISELVCEHNSEQTHESAVCKNHKNNNSLFAINRNHISTEVYKLSKNATYLFDVFKTTLPLLRHY